VTAVIVEKVAMEKEVLEKEVVGKEVVGKEVVGKEVVGKEVVGKEVVGKDTILLAAAAMGPVSTYMCCTITLLVARFRHLGSTRKCVPSLSDLTVHLCQYYSRLQL
jgi:hypothetical protein